MPNLNTFDQNIFHQKGQPRSLGELKRLAREFLTGNYTTMVLVILIAGIFPAVLLSPFSIGFSFQTVTLNVEAVSNAIAAFIILILTRLVGAAVIRIHLLLAQGQQPVFSDIFWAFRNQPDRYILAALLQAVLLLLPLIPAAIGIVALSDYRFAGNPTFYFFCCAVIIAILSVVELFLYYRYILVHPLYIEHPDMTIQTGFQVSRTLMHGNKKKLFLLQISFLGWRLLGICSFGIGFLWISPYIAQTSANFYLDLTGSLDRKKQGSMDITIDDFR